MNPDRPVVGPRPGRLEQWRVAEPVRLFLWPWIAATLALLCGAAFHPPAWALGLAAGFVLAGLFVGGEAARKSTMTPVDLIRAKQKETRP